LICDYLKFDEKISDGYDLFFIGPDQCFVNTPSKTKGGKKTFPPLNLIIKD